MYKSLLELTRQILLLRYDGDSRLIVRHLPGKHSQQRHRGKTGGRVLKPGDFTKPEQAQKWLKDTHGVEADLAGFNKKQINEISAGVDKVASIYKGDLPINKIEQVQGERYALRAGGKTIKINTDSFNEALIAETSDTGIARHRNSKRRLERAKKQLAESGDNLSSEDKKLLTNRIARLEDRVDNFKPVPFGASENYSDFIVHEIAHEIHIDLKGGVVSEVTEFLPPSKMRERGIDFNSSLSARLDAIARQGGASISEYAATNSEEYFAEAFVKYAQGNKEVIHPDLLDVFGKITK